MDSRISEFSFKRDNFTLEDVVIEKVGIAQKMLLILDDLLLEDVKPGDIEGEKALALYYGIRNYLSDVEEILYNLDRELMEDGFYKKEKAPNKVSRAIPAGR